TPFPSSYELFYPVVAGKIPGDRFYKLKLLKEWFTGKLIFNSIRKTDYHLILSKKRLVEAENQILKNKDFSQVNDSLTKSIEEIKTAIEISKRAKESGEQVQDVLNTIKTVGTNEADFIEKTLLQSTPENQKEYLIKSSQTIRTLIKEID
ncbi:MAG: DUF5667 domain-containing protein, partial [bacterium]